MKKLPEPDVKPLLEDIKQSEFNNYLRKHKYNLRRELIFPLLIFIMFILIYIQMTNLLTEKEIEHELIYKEITQYSGSSINNNIQGAHSIFPSNLVLMNLRSLGLETGVLAGYSMQPSFFEGNTAILKPIYNDSSYPLKSGEIIRYFRTDENRTCPFDFFDDFKVFGSDPWIDNSFGVVHRIKGVYGDDIITQGDNLYEDELISRCQVTHVVVGILFT